MTDRTSHPTWLRAAALAMPLFALAACGGGTPSGEEAASEPTAPSSEWVEPNPTEPAVPVNLPEAEMTNAPAETPAASPTP